MSAIQDPLVAPLPPEVPLVNAPLVRVIVQLRFPAILAVEQREFVSPFQEAVRKTYPVLRREQTQGYLLSPSGLAPTPPQVTWRFSDTDTHWRLSLAPDFLALETTLYTSRADLLARLRVAAEALEKHLEPKQIDRLGVRYIDRITGSALDGIAELVRAEVRGITGTAAAEHAVQAISESVFELPGAAVIARWGRLRGGISVDPAAIEPIDEPSWILDLDMFSSSAMPFTVDRVVTDATRFAERLYTMFRWAVTDDFLRRYGGTP